MRGVRIQHLIETPSSPRTVCGCFVSSGAEISNSIAIKNLRLCEKCYAWVGKKMIGDWLGLDFFDGNDPSFS